MTWFAAGLASVTETIVMLVPVTFCAKREANPDPTTTLAGLVDNGNGVEGAAYAIRIVSTGNPVIAAPATAANAANQNPRPTDRPAIRRRKIVPAITTMKSAAAMLVHGLSGTAVLAPLKATMIVGDACAATDPEVSNATAAVLAVAAILESMFTPPPRQSVAC